MEQPHFDKLFEFPDYSVRVTSTSITYIKGDLKITLPSNFTNKWNPDPQSNELIIENMYMRFYCIPPESFKGMFDFIARGFEVHTPTFPLFKNPAGEKQV